MNHIERHFRQALDHRKNQFSLRTLSVYEGLTDFCSNDYLGFAHSEYIQKKTHIYLHNIKTPNGATGSRLISGNYPHTEALEQRIADYHCAEAALLFNSGYDANIGLFSSIATRHDTIIYDALVHASIRDGIRLSHANSFAFAHNSLPALEQKLQRATGRIFVAVESVYSMDGDLCPLPQIVHLCQQYDAALIVDEAHGLGVVGKQGAGLVQSLGLEKVVWARIYTYGKALGMHGAAVVGSTLLKDYLINFARSFIYTTALPPHSVLSIRVGYELLQTTDAVTRLHQNIVFFKEHLHPSVRQLFIPSDSAIQCLVLPNNQAVQQLASRIQAAGFFVKAILHPTVPKGNERIRICLHAFNTHKEMEGLCKVLNTPTPEYTFSVR